jgi:hypothetical protein
VTTNETTEPKYGHHLYPTAIAVGPTTVTFYRLKRDGFHLYQTVALPLDPVYAKRLAEGYMLDPDVAAKLI